MMNKHGTLCSKGLMNGSPTSLANNKVMAVEKLRYFLGPSFDGDAPGVLLLNFLGPAVNFSEVFPQDDGQLARWPRGIKQFTRDSSDVRFFGGGEVEDAKRVKGGSGVNGLEFCKMWVDRKPGINDFFSWKAMLDEGFFGKLVCYEPEVGWSFSPGCINGDGVGNNGENRNLGYAPLEDTLHEIWIERVGADNGIWLVFEDELIKLVLGLAHERQTLFGKITALSGLVNSLPKPGGMSGNLAVEILQASIEPWRAYCTGVGVNGLAVLAESPLQVAGSAIMTFSKASGQDEDFHLPLFL